MKGDYNLPTKNRSALAVRDDPHMKGDYNGGVQGVDVDRGSR